MSVVQPEVSNPTPVPNSSADPRTVLAIEYYIKLTTSPIPTHPALQEGSGRLVEAWWASGDFLGVASDPSSGDLYAISRWGALATLDWSEHRFRVVGLHIPNDELPLSKARVQVRNIAATDTLEFVVQHDPRKVSAFDADGSRKWTFAPGDFINDFDVLRSASHPPCSTEGVAVACAGDSSIRLVDSNGVSRWTTPNIVSAHSVATSTSEANRCDTVLATGHNRFVYSVNVVQKKVTLLYPQVLDPAVRETGDESAQYLSQDTHDGALVAITGKGNVAWQSLLPKGAKYVSDTALSPDGRWWAVAFLEGVVAVYDRKTGSLLGTALCGTSQLAWTPATRDRPQQLIAASYPLRAFEVQVTSESKASGQPPVESADIPQKGP